MANARQKLLAKTTIVRRNPFGFGKRKKADKKKRRETSSQGYYIGAKTAHGSLAWTGRAFSPHANFRREYKTQAEATKAVNKIKNRIPPEIRSLWLVKIKRPRTKTLR